MTGIPPTPPPAQVPAASQPAPVTAIPVSTPPPAIAALPAGSTIDATVAAIQQQTQQARAVVQLLTALGNVTVRLPFPIPPNATLQLQVQGSGANLQFRILAINGLALQPGPAAGPSLAEGGTLSGATPGLVSGAGWLAGGGTSRAQAPNLNSFLPPVQGRAEGSGAAEGAVTLPVGTHAAGIPATLVFGTQPKLPTGTQLILRLLGIDAPQEEPVSSQPAVAGGAGEPPEAAGPGLGVAPHPEGHGVETGLEAGVPELILVPPDQPGEVVVPRSVPGQTATIQTPQAQPGAAEATQDQSPLAAGSRLEGTVAPNSLGGKPLIQTPVGLIALADAPDLAPGARVVFELATDPALPPLASQSAAPATSGAPQPAPGWANLSDALAALQKADPDMAQAILQRLPGPSPQFMLNAAGWVAAAETGDLRGWLGDRAVKALEKAGRPDLIERLAGDMAEMRTPVTLPQQGTNAWQTMILPFYIEQRIERIRLTMRRGRGDAEDEDGTEEEGLRFLVDVDMSQLGALQFDGLVKRQAKSFDLIVRSRRELPDDVRREIGIIFARALDNMGMVGAAVFKQAVAFVEPLPVASIGTGVMI